MIKKSINKRHFQVLILIATFFCFFYIFSCKASAEDSNKKNKLPEYIEGEVIIKLKSKKFNIKKTLEKEKTKTAERITGKTKELLEKQKIIKKDDQVSKIHDNINAVVVKNKNKSTKDLLEDYKSNSAVEYAEPNYIRKLHFTVNDPVFSSQWGLENSNDHDVDIKKTWDLETTSDQEVIVAMIDSGVKYDHEDLINNMWNGNICVDLLGNSSTCPNHGWDFYDGDDDPFYNTNIHGTVVAGIFGAETNNSIGISGFSYQNNLKIMALRAGDLYLSMSAIIDSINFAKKNQAKVINASYGGYGFSQSEMDAIADFNGIFVTAAGNQTPGHTGDNDQEDFYPCSYSLSNNICVAASNSDDELASFSHYGKTTVDIAAPGEVITSTSVDLSSNDTYAAYSGTSFAAPFVSGMVGLLYSKHPNISSKKIIESIKDFSDYVSNLENKVVSSRRLNAYQILANINIEKKPTYRFWSPVYTSHFFTASEQEKNHIISTWPDIWQYEGVAWYE
ncbi:MAG: S8 family serine peptidase [Candidatus Moranbacteria bacterium]|nr:S8 family serine peptidase [Candidatus Moranbacteria bacterium]